MGHVGERGDFSPKVPETPSSKSTGSSAEEKVVAVARVLLTPLATEGSSSLDESRVAASAKTTDSDHSKPTLAFLVDEDETTPRSSTPAGISLSSAAEESLESQIPGLMSLEIGLLTREELKDELRAIYNEIAESKFAENPDGNTQAFFRDAFKRSRGYEIPRSFFLEKRGGQVFVTIALNRQNIWRSSTLTGDGFPFKATGAVKDFKWGMRFNVSDPTSAEAVVISSERASPATAKEASILAQLSENPHSIHAHLATTHFSKKTYATKQTIIFAYYSNGNLHEALTKGLGSEEKWEALKQITEGLASIHAEGISHRDIKPANIFSVVERGHPPTAWKPSSLGLGGNAAPFLFYENKF